MCTVNVIQMCTVNRIPTLEIMNYLIVKKLGRFYLLPKIHKQTMNVPSYQTMGKLQKEYLHF